MEEPKKLIYDSGEQPEEVFLRVSGYLDRDRLYVGIYQTEYGYPELFSDLTVNLHHAPLNGVNEAYIDHNFSKEHLRFIRKYKLGRVLPETAVSGYCTFQKVAFDLKKLAEYDPQGTREFMEKPRHPDCGCTKAETKEQITERKVENNMEVKMNKEIRDYQESMFWGLSFRQCLFSVLAILAALGIYFLTRKYAGEQVTGWLCVLGAAPFAACGFFPLPRHDGRTVCMDSHQIRTAVPRNGWYSNRRTCTFPAWKRACGWVKK